MLHVEHFKTLIIQPALERIGLYSESASQLLLGTALQESNLRYLKQLGNGPALGLFQMEPATHDDIWNNFLLYRGVLADKVEVLAPGYDAAPMVWNLIYAAAMCRVHYYRVPEALPAAGDYEAQANYWKRFYNTELGAGTREEYLVNWYALSGVPLET